MDVFIIYLLFKNNFLLNIVFLLKKIICLDIYCSPQKPLKISWQLTFLYNKIFIVSINHRIPALWAGFCGEQYVRQEFKCYKQIWNTLNLNTLQDIMFLDSPTTHCTGLMQGSVIWFLALRTITDSNRNVRDYHWFCDQQ